MQTLPATYPATPSANVPMGLPVTPSVPPWTPAPTRDKKITTLDKVMIAIVLVLLVMYHEDIMSVLFSSSKSLEEDTTAFEIPETSLSSTQTFSSTSTASPLEADPQTPPEADPQTPQTPKNIVGCGPGEKGCQCYYITPCNSKKPYCKLASACAPGASLPTWTVDKYAHGYGASELSNTEARECLSNDASSIYNRKHAWKKACGNNIFADTRLALNVLQAAYQTHNYDGTPV